MVYHLIANLIYKANYISYWLYGNILELISGGICLKKIKLNTVICFCFVLFSLFYFYLAMQLKLWSSKYAPGPGFIPRWASGIMFVLSLIAFVQSLKEDGISLKEVLPASRTSRINLYVCWGGLIFFLLFVKRIGFVATSVILLSTLFSRGTKWPRAVLLGTIVSVCCFVIFKIVLQVQIPTNQFGW